MRKRKLKDWVKVLIAFILFLLASKIIFSIRTETVERHNKINKTYSKIEKIVDNIPKNNTKIEKSVETMPENDTISQSNVTSYTTRLTSFYANDGYGTGSCTGTGLCENDFQVNENGWYTYQGKLVLATATPYLLNYGYGLADGIMTYNYYDEVTVIIDDISYQAIIVDSCGVCMVDNRIDLFVSNRESVKDTMVEVII